MTIFVLWFLLLLMVFVASVAVIICVTALEESKKWSNEAKLANENAKKNKEEYEKIKNAPKIELMQAKAKADEMIKEAVKKAKVIIEESENEVRDEKLKLEEIIREGEREKNVLKEEMDVLRKKSRKYEGIAEAMRNIIEGYGDEYLVPLPDLMDELADQFPHTDPGKKLKEAREISRKMIKNGEATRTKCREAAKANTLSQILLSSFLGKAENALGKIKTDNYGKIKQEIIDIFNLSNRDSDSIEGTMIRKEFLEITLTQLKWASIIQGIKEEQREEQRRIREKIREEEKALREYEKVQKEALKEEEMLQKAMAIAHEKLTRASQEEKAKLEEQLKELGDKLAIAEEKGKRALSMAQQTKCGHVYIISNIGSFGENVFKIGLTRRLEPLDRVRELGDSSVPFEFDVHALIKSEDAPALENKLHKHFVLNQVNKVNYRKEFFKVGLTKIREEIEKMGLEATWTMAASALEYRETRVIEKKIQEDPVARESWVQRQLELDPTDMQSIDYHLESSALEE